VIEDDRVRVEPHQVELVKARADRPLDPDAALSEVLSEAEPLDDLAHLPKKARSIPG
jgi:hypothetical protein